MKNLSQQEAKSLFAKIADGQVDKAELKSLLLDLKEKGETPAEIAGAASAFLEVATKFNTPNYEVFDCVGTGGDGLGTLNVSTAAMFVGAQMGLKMAKHGNVAVSSKCGSADVLKQCGVKIDMDPKVARRCLDEFGVTFLFAPIYHPGMKHAMSVRRSLKTRTIFNILGPLLNPARPNNQLTGVYSESLVKPYADTLLRLGTKRGLVVHGSGLDEIGVHGPTTVCVIRDGDLSDFTIEPSEVGLKNYPLEAIKGGDIEENRDALQALLAGRGTEAYTALVAINSGALYWLSDKEENLKKCVQMALEIIRSGKCLNLVEQFAKMSNDD